MASAIRSDNALARPAARPLPAADTALPPDRIVVRKATIDLAVPAHGVREAFLKARQTVNEALGEFIEDSNLLVPDSGASASATLTLRVRADRLSDALNQLRPLGRVVAENSTGTDVTDQAVDLDARLTSEKRVETELSELLKRRSDDKLREVLELRQRLGEVRTSIERLTAQRDRLARLASLASVLVTLRADGEKPKEESFAFWARVQDRFGRALSGGLNDLTESVAGLLRFTLASAVPLSIIGAIALTVFRATRRLLNTSGPSAPPQSPAAAPAP